MPDHCDGVQERWRDWSTVMRAYTSVVDPRLGPQMPEAERSETPELRATLPQQEAESSSSLYFILLMLCRGAALDQVVKSGPSEGLEAWRQMILRHEPRVRSRFARQLVNLRGWSSRGDVVARLEAFEHKVAQYQHTSGEMLTDNLGIVTRQMTTDS